MATTKQFSIGAYQRYVSAARRAGMAEKEIYSIEEYTEKMCGRKMPIAAMRALRTATKGTYLQQVRKRLAKAMAPRPATRALLPWEIAAGKEETRKLLAHIKAGGAVVIGDDNKVRAVTEDEYRRARVISSIVEQVEAERSLKHKEVDEWRRTNKF